MMGLIRFFFVSIGILIAINFAFSDANWVITDGEIKNIHRMGNNYKYDVVYDIKVSDEIGEDDRYIPSPVEQTVLDAKLTTVENQKVKLRYMVSDPEKYELLSPIKYKAK